MTISDWRRLAQEAKARADKATPGPWIVESVTNEELHTELRLRKPDPAHVWPPVTIDERAEVLFEASARTDVPTLAAALEAACTEVEQWKANYGDIDRHNAELEAECERLRGKLEAMMLVEAGQAESIVHLLERIEQLEATQEAGE